MTAVQRAGTVGAGTMGAGIAQALAQSGVAVHLVDVDLPTARHGLGRIDADLRRGADHGRWTREEARLASARITAGCELEPLHDADLIVEAVPERFELKCDLLTRLARVCRDDAVLATNTSSLLVSALAARVPNPQRVIGLHFFNPAPLMGLVEVVPGVETSPGTLSLAVAIVRAMGKRPVVARDGIGFLVNRCARPFYGEALRLAQERIATVEQIDRICRLGGGFRMGPFELIDLIGVDVNFEIARSFYEQSFGEPRWRPSPLQAQLVAAGHHGRKAGRGFYRYGDAPHRPPDPDPVAPAGGDGRIVVIAGTGAIAEGICELAQQAGFRVLPRSWTDARLEDLWFCVDCRIAQGSEDPSLEPGAVLCARHSLSAQRTRGAAGFHVVPPLTDRRLVEITSDERTTPMALDRTHEFFAALGWVVEEVADAPGLVLGRIVSQLVNESAFALQEGIATADDVDAGMTLGLNHPLGPVAWRTAIGADHINAILEGLWEQRHEERYRRAPLLQRPVLGVAA